MNFEIYSIKGLKKPVRFMVSTYNRAWSDEALFNLKDIIDYLERRWSEKEIKNLHSSWKNK